MSNSEQGRERLQISDLAGIANHLTNSNVAQPNSIQREDQNRDELIKHELIKHELFAVKKNK